MTPIDLLHEELRQRFLQLADSRKGPIYAIEHGTTRARLLHALEGASRMQVQEGWLVAVAWAAEIGFDHVQNQEFGFWNNFRIAGLKWFTEVELPGKLQLWFSDFSAQYRGAVPPDGPLKARNPNVVWPLVHGVIPQSVRNRLAEVVNIHGDALVRGLRGGESLAGMLMGLGDAQNPVFSQFVQTEALAEVAEALLLGEPLGEVDWISKEVLDRLEEAMSQPLLALRTRAPVAQTGGAIRVELEPRYMNRGWDVRVRLSDDSLHQTFSLGALRSLEIKLGGATLGTLDRVLCYGALLRQAMQAIGAGVDVIAFSVNRRSVDPSLDDLVRRIEVTTLPLRRRLWLIEDLPNAAPRAEEAAEVPQGAKALMWSPLTAPEADWSPTGALNLWSTDHAPTALGAPTSGRRPARFWVLGISAAIAGRGALTTFSDTATYLGVEQPPHRPARLRVWRTDGAREEGEILLPEVGDVAMVDLGLLAEGSYWVQLEGLDRRPVAAKALLQCVLRPRLAPTAVFVDAEVGVARTVGDLFTQGLPRVSVLVGLPVYLTLRLECARPARGVVAPPPVEVGLQIEAPGADITWSLEGLVHEAGAHLVSEDSAEVQLSAVWGGSALFTTVLPQRHGAAVLEREGMVVARDYDHFGLDSKYYWTEACPWERGELPDGGLAADGIAMAMVRTRDDRRWLRRSALDSEFDPRPQMGHALPGLVGYWNACQYWSVSQSEAGPDWRRFSRSMRARCLRAAIFHALTPVNDERLAKIWDDAERQPLTNDIGTFREALAGHVRVAFVRLGFNVNAQAGGRARLLVERMIEFLTNAQARFPVRDQAESPAARELVLHLGRQIQMLANHPDLNLRVSEDTIAFSLWCFGVRPSLRNPAPGTVVRIWQDGASQHLDFNANVGAGIQGKARGLIVARTFTLLASHYKWRPNGRRLHPLG